MDEQESLPPHVLIFPLPLQGPVNSMFKLAELLCFSGLHITILLTENIHNRLVLHTDISSRFDQCPGFQIKTISDGLPDDHPRDGGNFLEVFDSLRTKTKTLFKDMLTSDSLCVDVDGKVRRRVVSCIIADGVLGFTCDVADEIDVPIFCVRTISSCCLWIFFCLPELIESGEYPFKDDNLDEPIKSVPGTETFLRRRDLPDFCRSGDLTDPYIQLFKTEGQENSRAYGLILNTFEELDQPILNQMRTICPNLYPIGPIHAHLKKKQTTLRSSSNSLWAEDRTCIDWLDDQLPNSVIYVSFGSIATMTNDQLIEFWYGLVNSKQNFLWVIRPNSIGGEEWRSMMPVDLVKGTKERGYIVEWAPQEEVLAHPAVGGFWTHCGWNSILESVYEGKPMICWPYFFDQQVNSRFVEKVWGLGLDMKDTGDREIVEKMVKDLMVLRKQEFLGRANHMSKLAKNCLMEGGSSYSNFDRLGKDIKSLSNKV